eukprot:585852-Pelagomonas_calceolata.AAC.1
MHRHEQVGQCRASASLNLSSSSGSCANSSMKKKGPCTHSTMPVLRQKPEKLEDVHEQRKYIDGLPQAIGTLMQDIETTRAWYRHTAI